MIAATVLGLALPLGLAATPAVTTTKAAPISCYTDQSGNGDDDYPGPSASFRYDAYFTASFGLQHRFSHTQQGITTWRNWRGGQADLFLTTGYADGNDSYITVYRSDGRYLNTIRIAEGHVGGIAVSGDWAFINPGPGGDRQPLPYSTSQGRDKRSNIYSVRRGHRYPDDSVLSCFRAPSMAEGMTAYGGRVWLTFESGTVPYVRDPDTLNPIGNVHTASIAAQQALAH